MDPTLQTCLNCKYWVPGAGKDGKTDLTVLGECRRHAPFTSADKLAPIFPPTLATGGCGDGAPATIKRG